MMEFHKPIVNLQTVVTVAEVDFIFIPINMVENGYGANPQLLQDLGSTTLAMEIRSTSGECVLLSVKELLTAPRSYKVVSQKRSP